MPEAKPFVKITDGALPLPYVDDQFESIIATEVIEHVADPVAVVAELARINSKRAVITVPDASAIPDLFYANVVPWHLLESTHFNFFTINSLSSLLKPHYSRIDFAKIGSATVNGIPWHTNLVASCFK